MEASIILLLRLVLAHIITDFILQPDKWVRSKKEEKVRSGYLYLHGILTGLVAYLLLGDWQNYQVPVFIAVTHTLLDAGKLYLKDNLATFLYDQVAHLLVLFVAWLYLTDGFREVVPVLRSWLNNTDYMLLTVGFAFIIWPSSYLIGKATERWRQEVEDAINADAARLAVTSIATVVEASGAKHSLDRAGMYIGMLERVLVLIFVLADQFEAIGFLIAAKSILRFGDRSEQKPRKQTEYVLIGTLISFTITIILGLLLRYLVKI